MRKIIKELQYQFITLNRWLREQKLRLLGINREFYCQREFEFQSKCDHQCDHCKEYYSPLEK